MRVVERTSFLLITLVAISCSTKSTEIRNALALVDLDMIPSSSKNVEFATIGNMFSRTYYIRFEESTENIERWVNNSRVLKGITPAMYTESFQLLPSTELSKITKDYKAMHENYLNPKAEYYDGNEKIKWYKPTIEKKGRRWIIKQNRDAHYGEVIVDDISNAVFVRISYS